MINFFISVGLILIQSYAFEYILMGFSGKIIDNKGTIQM